MKTFKNLNEAFVKSLKFVETDGHNVESRGTKQREVLFYSSCIEDPTDLQIEVPARRFNDDYAIAEWLWYVSCSRKVNNIGKLANIWLRIQDDKGECESNYGTYLLGKQWKWVLGELLSDNDTRRATFAINQPHHKGKNNLDYPCTQYVQFFIRDECLHMGVNMRSNDAVFGYCNDVFTFSMFHQLMLNDYNSNVNRQKGKKIKLGRYYHTAGSFHVYETHWPMMDKILKNYYVKKSEEGYPILNKYKLRDNITSSFISEMSLPEEDMSKEAIFYFVNQIKGILYV